MVSIVTYYTSRYPHLSDKLLLCSLCSCNISTLLYSLILSLKSDLEYHCILTHFAQTIEIFFSSQFWKLEALKSKVLTFLISSRYSLLGLQISATSLCPHWPFLGVKSFLVPLICENFLLL